MKPTSPCLFGVWNAARTNWGLKPTGTTRAFLETSLFYQVSAAGIDVPHGGKPGQTLLVDKNPQRVTRCDQHIDTHVKFKAINQERL